MSVDPQEAPATTNNLLTKLLLTSSVIFKFHCNGSGDLVDLDDVKEVLKFQKSNYTHHKFQVMCVLSGCDYLKSLKGIGIKMAKKVVETAEDKKITE